MKELLQQKALEYARNHSSAPDKETPDWIITDYLAGAKEILDNPELYEWVKKEKYDELSKEATDYAFKIAELKEKVTELEGVIAKLSQKILNKSNY